MSIADRARDEIGYIVWADRVVLDAAAKLDEPQWAEVGAQFAHMLGTQLWWHGRWSSGKFVEPEIELPNARAARDAYDASHAALQAFGAGLDDAACGQREAWWKGYGYEQALSLGDIIMQVGHHGTQHRSEIAEALTRFGASPGDLDYIRYTFARDGHQPLP